MESYLAISVNNLLKEEITKMNQAALSPGFLGQGDMRDIRHTRVLLENLVRLIDELGELSSAAQGLNRVITTADKLRKSPTHSLYLMKDSKANGGDGELVALLKVGRKHLFLYDELSVVREFEPLCILDFYVRANYQRQGLGKKLFDHMLKEEGVNVVHLAIDGPSPKMEQFLKRNYSIDRLIRQSNNFAVSPQFFMSPDLSDSNTPESQAFPAVGRFTPIKHSSSVANVIHGGGSTNACYNENSSGSNTSDTNASTPGIGRLIASKPSSSIANVIYGGGSTSAYYNENSWPSSRGATTPEPMFSLEREAPSMPELELQANELQPELELQANELQPELELQANELQPELERPNTLQVEAIHRAGSRSPKSALTPNGYVRFPHRSPRRESQLTSQGFFDCKYYHNKLW